MRKSRLNTICSILALTTLSCTAPPRQEQIQHNQPHTVSTPSQLLPCPDYDNPVGLKIDNTFPSVQFPNVDWEPVNIKSHCGSKAVLVVSATEWCGSCLVEFDYLAQTAEAWKSRGVEVYYTIFENGASQPANAETLLIFEDYMFDIYGSIPFRVLADPTSLLPRSLAGRVTLPVGWLLDETMTVREFSEGTNASMISRWVEDLLQAKALSDTDEDAR